MKFYTDNKGTVIFLNQCLHLKLFPREVRFTLIDGSIQQILFKSDQEAKEEYQLIIDSLS